MIFYLAIIFAIVAVIGVQVIGNAHRHAELMKRGKALEQILFGEENMQDENNPII